MDLLFFVGQIVLGKSRQNYHNKDLRSSKPSHKVLIRYSQPIYQYIRMKTIYLDVHIIHSLVPDVKEHAELFECDLTIVVGVNVPEYFLDVRLFEIASQQL